MKKALQSLRCGDSIRPTVAEATRREAHLQSKCSALAMVVPSPRLLVLPAESHCSWASRFRHGCCVEPALTRRSNPAFGRLGFGSRLPATALQTS